ncbi:N-acetylneuraminate synthase [Clostridiaceae bacterium M8S5]|nr:N-acetylneuraminate synthase [Clostridiaceae bacterium M8S5]
MGNRVYIIAEIGVNHNGSLEMAKRLINIASNAGVDAVKFQTFQTDKCMISSAPKAPYQIDNTNSNESQYEMVKKLELNQQIHFELRDYSIKNNVQFLSTPFDFESLDFLVNRLNLPTIKIASGEITNAPLLLKTARTGRKIILSTGMSTLGEVEEALGVIAFGYLGSDETPSERVFKKAYFSEEGQKYLRQNVSLLHCCTEYPAPYEDINLNALDILKKCFNLPIGYSDHSLGIAIPIAAVALGSVIIEKHITLDCNLPGPDHKASLEPKELFRMVKGIRQTEEALLKTQKKPTLSELKNLAIARKSIVASCNIKKGEKFTEENITVKRPGKGMSPFKYWNLLNKISHKSYQKDEVIK